MVFVLCAIFWCWGSLRCLQLTVELHEPANGSLAGCGWLGFGVVREAVVNRWRPFHGEAYKGRKQSAHHHAVFVFDE